MAGLLLSILIPSVPGRLAKAAELFHYLSVDDKRTKPPYEVLMLTDNHRRSIGAKRQALLDVALGDYVCFLDDDDGVSEPGHQFGVESILAAYPGAILGAIEAQRPDVVVFDSRCRINDGPWVTVRHGIEFENEQYNPAGFTRKPWHIHAWRREIAQRHRFPDVSYGEDWPWCKSMLEEVKTQARAGDRPLYYYDFNASTSEAK